MISDINVYLRDDVKLEKEKWDELLNIDCEEAKKNTHINYIHNMDDVYDYLDNHGNLYLNGHYYVIKTTGYSYDHVEELRDDLIEELNNFQDEHAIIEEILEEMNEEELLDFFKKSRRLHFTNGKITRSYDSNTEYYDDEDEED